jgi:hypothetical protein
VPAVARNVTLYSGHATPKNIVLRAQPAIALVPVPIYLYAGHATPANITLRDPTQAPAAGSDISVSGSASVVLAGMVASTVLESPATASSAVVFAGSATAVVELPSAAGSAIALAGSATALVEWPLSAASSAIVLSGSVVAVSDWVLAASPAVALVASVASAAEIVISAQSDMAVGAWAYPRTASGHVLDSGRLSTIKDYRRSRGNQRRGPRR